MKTTRFLKDSVKYLILIAIMLITILPIVYAIASSFKTNSEIMANPGMLFSQHPSFENYRTALHSKNFNILLMTWNSTYYTACSVFVALFFAGLNGYVFARGDFPGKKIIFAVFSAMMFISVGSITIYPTFEILNMFKWSTNLWGLIVLHIFGVGIVNIYIIRGYIRTLPRSLDDAANIDGCGYIGTYFKIILPLLKPVMATIGLLAFQGSWNEYLMPTLFTMSNPKQRTLIVGIMALKTSGAAAASWNLMLAGTTVAMIPVLAVYAFCNKYFVNGIAAGAIKE